MAISREEALNARNITVAYLTQIRDQLVELLKNRLGEEDYSFYLPASKGKYSAYKWIQVTEIKSQTIYWLTLFSNDYDSDSFNFHTVIGSIQFWRDIVSHPTPKGNRLGPNESLDSLAYLPMGTSSNDKCADINVNVFSQDFDPEDIVDRFIRFCGF